MEKIKELGWKPVAAAGAVLGLLAGILGVAGVGVGALIVGILAAVVTFGGVFIVCGDGTSGSGGKGDKYKKLFMNLPIGFAQAKIIDDPVNGVSYQIVDANEIFGEYFKLDVSDYTGKNLKESKIEVLQDINAWFTAYNNSGTKEGDLMDVEITMESLQKVFNTVMYKSEADYINMVVIDITDQKDTENKLSKAIVDANAAYKTQAEFLANMSHEIRTPLNAIVGFSSLLTSAEISPEEREEYSAIISTNSELMLTLINDIIQLSQLDGGKKDVEYRDLDLFPLARECVDMLQMNAQKQNVTIRVQGGEAPIFADKQLMEELIYNLCDNAIRYNKKDGTVTVTTGIENGHTFLSVKDTGIGISAEHQERVFERFYRVDKSRSKATGGTGLGLAIVKHIVAQHGAKLTLESEQGKGTEIRVEFSEALKQHELETAKQRQEAHAERSENGSSD